MSLIDNSDVSVVVQGPVQNYQGRSHHEEGITVRCLNSIRQYLPGATIILSTWDNQDLTSLDYDQLVISPDPGSNTDSFCPTNYNRQILSTKAGLTQVETRYTMKLRSDNYLIGAEFKAVQQHYVKSNPADKLFTEKVVINANLFRRYSHGFPVAFSPSDFFYFGLTSDLLKIWNQPFFCDQPFSEQLIKKKEGTIGPPPLEAEQVYCVVWMRNLVGSSPLMISRYDCAKDDLDFWLRFLASNLVVFEPRDIGLGLRKMSLRKKKRTNEFTKWDWLSLYRQYCDSSIDIDWPMERLLIAARRAVKLPLSRLRGSFRR